MTTRGKVLRKDTQAQIAAYCHEVRRRRESLGLTLEALGERAALSPNYIGSVEIGRRDPSLSTIFGLADALAVHPGDLLVNPDGLSPASIEAARLYEGAPPELQTVLLALLRMLHKQHTSRPRRRAH